MPQKLDYHGPERRQPSWTQWFWSGLWPEIRSEFAGVPLWLLVPFLALVLAFVAGCLLVAFGLVAAVLG